MPMSPSPTASASSWRRSANICRKAARACVSAMKQPERILVVDDNETNRDILEARLTANGYEVLHAGDGEEALAMATRHRPDLILLDIMMPKVDGIEVCRRIKADAELALTPIILVTAKSDSKDVVDGFDAGAGH